MSFLVNYVLPKNIPSATFDVFCYSFHGKELRRKLQPIEINNIAPSWTDDPPKSTLSFPTAGKAAYLT
jgi:hypothetical protein